MREIRVLALLKIIEETFGTDVATTAYQRVHAKTFSALVPLLAIRCDGVCLKPCRIGACDIGQTPCRFRIAAL